MNVPSCGEELHINANLDAIKLMRNELALRVESSGGKFFNYACAISWIIKNLYIMAESKEDYCSKCGILDGDRKWVACDGCCRWYHQDCVGFKNSNKNGSVQCALY